jgi:hypothetical protein
MLLLAPLISVHGHLDGECLKRYGFLFLSVNYCETTLRELGAM